MPRHARQRMLSWKGFSSGTSEKVSVQLVGVGIAVLVAGGVAIVEVGGGGVKLGVGGGGVEVSVGWGVEVVGTAVLVGVVTGVRVGVGVGSSEPAQKTPVIVPPNAVRFSMVPLTLAKKMLSV